MLFFSPSPQDLMQQNDIAYVLNASNTCPKPDFIPESHFLRVPVNDSFCEKILPWLDKSVEFIGQRGKSLLGGPNFSSNEGKISLLLKMQPLLMQTVATVCVCVCVFVKSHLDICYVRLLYVMHSRLP